MTDKQECLLFVTGKLAESALRQVVSEIEQAQGFATRVVVLGISVAALMHVRWLLKKLEVPEDVTKVILPGWCQGDISELEKQFGVPFERGPKDLRELPRYFNKKHSRQIDLSAYDLEIIAEINHAPLLTDRELLSQADNLRRAGADRIDYGCIAGEGFPITPRHVKLLIDEGHRVSIDSFDRWEVEQAIEAGASLVLSCNSTNVDWLSRLHTEVVVVPDDFNNLQTMTPIIAQLESAGTPYRLDPILEPIGFGFFRSVQRYAETRRLWPDAAIMMGTGNVTELSEVDSAGVNFLLTAICLELKIHSVLTTQVINWARSSVREIDVSRRLIKYSLDHQQIPKHLDSSLVRLRDPYVYPQGADELSQLASQLKDPNFRIFSEPDALHLMNRDGHWQGEDPFAMIRDVLQKTSLDAAHAFYLGYEMAQAETARLLGKKYIQDEPLNWGDLSVNKPRESLRHTNIVSPTKSEQQAKTSQQTPTDNKPDSDFSLESDDPG